MRVNRFLSQFIMDYLYYDKKINKVGITQVLLNILYKNETYKIE